MLTHDWLLYVCAFEPKRDFVCEILCVFIQPRNMENNDTQKYNYFRKECYLLYIL